MSRSRTERAARLITAAAAAIGFGVWLAGCSDIYLDRRDTVALTGGDSIAANEAEQMVDPWPRSSGDKNIASNGQKMQVAVERYRTGRVIPPINATTSEIEAPPAQGASGAPSSGTQSAGAPAATASAAQ
jgi:hypothetical protein